MTAKKRIQGLLSVAAVLILLMTALFFTGRLKEAVAAFSKEVPQASIIIDPGHGGVDGGAVGVSGVVEKEINLAIAMTLREMLEAMGYQVLLTREEDVSIHDSRVEGISAQKKSDLHNRLALMEQYPDALVISIHQNEFSKPQYYGAQMFYGKNHPESKELAAALQAEITTLLQPENTREIKPAGKEIFLLDRCNNPIVLAECGFLSNPEEEALLQQEEYQRQMAFAIASAVAKYHSAKGTDR